MNLDIQLQPPPEFFDHRLMIFNQLKAEYDTWVAGTFFSATFIA